VLRWEEPQRRVARGQSIVLYDTSDEVVLGGALAA
jgi:tRNA U34 2-thiouridine synthase MnmA/TrmU